MRSQLIGINNRNLNDFSVDINNSIKISNLIEGDKIVIAESGIRSQADINHIKKNSCIDTFLVGESLMKSTKIGEDIRNLIN